MADMAQLREQIRQAAHEAGGYRTLARRAGGRVSPATLNNIVNGRHSGRFGRERIDGIALALGVSAKEIGDMLGVEAGDPPPPFKVPERAMYLTQPQRRVVLSVIDAILSASGGEEDAKPADVVPIRREPAKAVDRPRAVARKRSKDARPLDQDEQFD